MYTRYEFLKSLPEVADMQIIVTMDHKDHFNFNPDIEWTMF